MGVWGQLSVLPEGASVHLTIPNSGPQGYSAVSHSIPLPSNSFLHISPSPFGPYHLPTVSNPFP